MPRITKKLPADRSDYSFGDLVYWHLFKYGTRPNGEPTAKAGRVWDLDDICFILEITHRTLRNWIADKHLPDTITRLSGELFGNNSVWDDARLELQAKFEAGWTAKRSGARPGKASASTSAHQESTADTEAADRSSQENADEAEGSRSNPHDDRSGAAHTSHAIKLRTPERLRPIDSSERQPRWQARALAAGLAGVVAAAGWMHFSRKAEPPSPAPQKVAEVVVPKPEPPVVVPEQGPKAAPIELPPAPSAPPAATAPVDHKQPAPAEPAPSPSIEDERAEKRRLLAEKLIAARQEAHDQEMRRRDEEARKRDSDLQSAANLQRQLEDDARTVAGIGYRLRENTSVAGASFRHLVMGTVADCALACVKNNCDAFSWYRDQYPASSPRRRYCYLFKRPFEIANYPGYAFGERTSEPLVKSSLAPSQGFDRPVRLAQAGPPKNVPAQADDLTRCAGGPVRASGFKLTCDRTLGGGTTLGSAQLSYTVANINECAAKCRPIARCLGFTFNSGDPPGRHACIIFGPTPEGRESKGWISGVR